MELEILYEDTDIIVCYKPAGVATQTKSLGAQDMESLLKNYRASKGEEPVIGLIHRLDQPVEGVMVFAKTKEAAANLSEQVREHGAGKHYYALCRKNAEKPLAVGDKGTLTDFIAFDRRTNMSHIVPVDAAKRFQAKKAILDYNVIWEDDEKLCFDVTLHTGRHHQIRLQLDHLGFPIIGDQKYSDRKLALEGKTPEKQQLCLCSYRLSFAHPKSAEQMDFRIQPKNPMLVRIS